MLVLSRKVDEDILIRIPDGNGGHTEVWITVTEVNTRGKVRLGIDAPNEIGIYRREVWEAMQEGK